MIVIVSGPPGAGKTTVSAGLAGRRGRSVHVSGDEFFRWISGGFVPPHLPEAHEQNTAVVDATLSTVVTYADAGYDVIWDGVVGPWWLDRIVDRLGHRVSATHWLVLRPSRATGLARVTARDGTATTSGAETMADQFAHLGDLERHVIDAERPIDALLDACDAAIAASTHLLPRAG